MELEFFLQTFLYENSRSNILRQSKMESQAPLLKENTGIIELDNIYFLPADISNSMIQIKVV